jgi:hypothetical protein
MLVWLERLVQLGAVGVAAVAGAVLLGWLGDIALLKQVDPRWVSMKANTACCFLATGGALWCLRLASPTPPRRLLGLLLAATVATVGGLTLLEYLGALDLGIDQLLFRDDPASPGSSPPGRMALATALNFLLLGLALLGLDVRGSLPRGSAQWLAVAVHLLSVLALVGYAYDVTALYQVRPYSSMAVHTAGTFWLASLAILAARPTHGFMQVVVSATAGGGVARRLLLAIPVVLFALGWGCLRGADAGWYTARFALCILVLLGMGSAVLLVAYQARVLYRVDLERQRAAAEVVALNVGLEHKVQERTRALEHTLAQVQRLHGLLPICAWCKKIR